MSALLPTLVLHLVVGWPLALLLLGDRRRAPAALLCAAVAAGVLAVAVVAHTLAAAGAFSAPSLLGALGVLWAASAAGLVALRRSPLPVERSPRALLDLAPLALVGALVLLYGEPAQYLWGSADEGVYTNAALEIAHGGSVRFRDALLDSLPRSVASANLGELVPGFIFLDFPERGDVVPHAFHFFPSWLAALRVVGGLDALFAGPIFLVLGAVLGVYVLAARFGGWPAGLLAATLVGIDPASVWFSRVTNAEGMTLFLLTTGFALAALSVPRDTGDAGDAGDERGESPGAALLAGAVLGAVHLAKIEFLALPWAVFAFAAFQLAAGRRPRAVVPLVGGYALLLALGAFHGFRLHRVYFLAQLVNPEMYGKANLYGYVGAFALALLATGLALAQRRRLPELARRLPLRGLVLAGGAVAVCLGAYLYWLLPAQSEWGLAPAEELTPLQRALAVVPELVPGTQRRTWRETTFQQLGLYIGAAGVLAGLAGAFALMLRRDCLALAPFLLLVLAQTAFFLLVSGKLDYGSANPHTPGRRFLSLTIPGFLVAGIVPWFAWARGAPLAARAALWAGGAAVFALVARGSWAAALPVARNSVWTASVDCVRALADRGGDDVVWIVGKADGAANRYGNPLRFLERERVFALSYWVTPEQAQELLFELERRGWTPVLIEGGGRQDDPRGGRAWLRAVLEPRGHERIVLPEETVVYQRERIPRAADYQCWYCTLDLYGGLGG